MVKLMVVIHSLLGGGSERVAVNLLRGLDKYEFSLTLVLYEPIFDYPLPGDVDVIILDIPSTWNIFKLTGNFIRKIVRLAVVIRKTDPDIVFSLLTSTNITVILAKVLSRVRCKMIVSEHTHPSVNLRNEPYGGITKHFMKYIYPKADRIIAVSEGVKKDLIEVSGLSKEKIKVIYNPVDIEEIETLSREEPDHPWFHEGLPIIVSMGRLTKEKGYPYLIKAFSTVRQSLPCRLLIIGKGEDEGNLARMVKALGVEGDVQFLGFQKNPFKYMARSSVFVLSSLYEGLGNVIVEAMALGLPVISTDCPSGPSEIIEDRKNGLLVPVKDEKALTQAIVDVLTDGELRKGLSEEAKKRAQFFALKKIAEQYGSFFLDNSPSPS
jgi:glycosyltransferase involved in cell wall biosynthesis